MSASSNRLKDCTQIFLGFKSETKPKKMPHDRRVLSKAQPKALPESGSGLKELRSYLIVHYAGARQVERKQLQSPFLKRFLKASREWGEAEWADDVERRLRKVVATIDPTPQILNYTVQRLINRVSIHTSTPNEARKQEMIALSTGQWPGWEKIMKAVPELGASIVHFDVHSKWEWERVWDVEEELSRLRGARHFPIGSSMKFSFLPHFRTVPSKTGFPETS